MATGLYLLHGGSVLVAYGRRRIPISRAQYKANGYRPALEELAAKAPVAKLRGSFKDRLAGRTPSA